jgi:hypothetical protein
MLPKRLAAPGLCLQVCEVRVRSLSSDARTEQRRGLSALCERANEGNGARVAVRRQAASNGVC